MGMADAVELDWLVTRMRPIAFFGQLVIPTVMVAGTTALLTSAGCDLHPQSQPNHAAPTGAQAPVAQSLAAPAAAAQTGAPDVKSFVTTGPLVADKQADIAAERAGRVVSIAVGIGDRVKAGQTLARLDDRVLRSTADAQKARIVSAQASVREWEAEEESAKASLRRANTLHTDQIISEEEWELAKSRLDQTSAAVARYHGEEAAAEADCNVANLQLEQSRIVAPFDGVVGRESVRPSQEVKAGDVLFWITAEAPLRVLFTVPESVMAAFPVGAELELTTADYPGQHQAAHILRVSPVVDPASGSVQVIGAVDHPSPLLKPGMSMQIRLAQVRIAP